MKLQLLLAVALAANAVAFKPGDAYNHIKNAYVPAGIRWMEIGFFQIVQSSWTSISATYTNFSDPVVFLSLPNLAGQTSSDGKPMSLRVKDAKLTYVNHDLKTYSFAARSYSVNDTYCTFKNLYYTPADLLIPSSFIGWLVVERGMYNISHKGFIIQTDAINRTNVNDSTDKRNQFKSFAPSLVCNFGQNCKLDNVALILTIAQLQTTRYSRFLLLRALAVGKRFVVYVLTPHDSLSNANFLIPSPGENYAWMLFENGLKVTCVENLIIETFKVGVTYIKANVNYGVSFTVPPAVFGMVQTLLGRDSLGLRVFNLGLTSSDFITQEDKCTDSETQHTTTEQAALLVIGQSGSGTIICAARYSDTRPSEAPTAMPSTSKAPSAKPSSAPSSKPSAAPSQVPTGLTGNPSISPTAAPSTVPSAKPSAAPSAEPSAAPSAIPSTKPSTGPTSVPSAAPSAEPSAEPSAAPSAIPSTKPSTGPTSVPSAAPSAEPSAEPTAEPTEAPTAKPSAEPTTTEPTESPTARPSRVPTLDPTRAPTANITSTWCTYVTLFDTFGDGWGPDIALEVSLAEYGGSSTLLAPLYVFYDCPEGGPVELCWQEGDIVSFDIVSLNPPAKETWEIYWTLALEGETFLGDFHTSMNVTEFSVAVTDPVDMDNRTCTRCKHPPKPPSKSRSKPGPSPAGGESSGPSDGRRGLLSDGAADSSEGSAGDSDGGRGASAGAKGKGPGAGKPKPLWPFPVTLFDAHGDGWFNASQAWTPVPLHACGGAVSFPAGRALPATLTAPEYVISTIDRVRPLRRHAVCGALLREACEERLPDAPYIFRVTGGLSKWDTSNNTAWEFCGTRGTSTQELEFKLIHGKCFPGKKSSAANMCCGDVTAAFSGVLTLTLAAGGALEAGLELSEFDTALLEHGLAEAFSASLSLPDADADAGSLHGSIALTAWSRSVSPAGSQLVVPFSMTFAPAAFGLSGMYRDEMQALAATLSASADSFTSGGSFVSFVQTSLMGLPLGKADSLDGLLGAAVSDVTFLSSDVTAGVGAGAGGHASVAGGALAAAEAAPAAAPASGTKSDVVSFEQSATVLLAALLAAAVALTAFRSIRQSGGDREGRVDDSGHDLLADSGEGRDLYGMLLENPPSML
jgi:hypothetical protein